MAGSASRHHQTKQGNHHLQHCPPRAAGAARESLFLTLSCSLTLCELRAGWGCWSAGRTMLEVVDLLRFGVRGVQIKPPEGSWRTILISGRPGAARREGRAGLRSRWGPVLVTAFSHVWYERRDERRRRRRSRLFSPRAVGTATGARRAPGRGACEHRAGSAGSKLPSQLKVFTLRGGANPAHSAQSSGDASRQRRRAGRRRKSNGDTALKRCGLVQWR